MKNKLTLIILAVVIVVCISISLLTQKAKSNTAPEVAPVTSTDSVQNDTTTTKTSTVKSSTDGITQSEVSKHNSAQSCYTIVNNNVYDLTKWVAKHPGGQSAIKAMCGIDSSEMFNNQHGGQGGPERILATFKIGSLIK